LTAVNRGIVIDNRIEGSTEVKTASINSCRIACNRTIVENAVFAVISTCRPAVRRPVADQQTVVERAGFARATSRSAAARFIRIESQYTSVEDSTKRTAASIAAEAGAVRGIPFQCAVDERSPERTTPSVSRRIAGDDAVRYQHAG